MANIFTNGNLAIKVRDISVLRISKAEPDKVEVFADNVKNTIVCANEEDAQTVFSHIYREMLQEP
jgi:hypothetical protein